MGLNLILTIQHEEAETGRSLALLAASQHNSMASLDMVRDPSCL